MAQDVPILSMFAYRTLIQTHGLRSAWRTRGVLSDPPIIEHGGMQVQCAKDGAYGPSSFEGERLFYLTVQ